MKKLCNLLLCLALVAALTLTVSAAGSSVTLAASTKAVEAGQTFTVEATLNNTDAIMVGTVTLSYNEDALELIGGTCHVPNTTIAQVLPAQKAGTFMVSLKKVSGKLFTFEFRVRDNADPGTYEIAGKAAIGTTGGNYIEVNNTQIKVGCTHKAAEQWSSNYAEHWHFCDGCAERLDAAAHTPAEDKTCTVCGYKPAASGEGATVPNAPGTDAPQTPSAPTSSQTPAETIAGEQTGQSTQTTVQPTQQDQPDQLEDAPSEGTTPEEQENLEKGGSFWWWIVGILAIGGAAAGIVIWRKKKA